MEQKKQYVNSINLKNNTSFPYLVLDVINDTSSPLNAGFNVMHWHEDLQFIYVLSGKIDIVTLETTTVVYEGEGAFLNKNVVHMKKRGSPCHYNSFIFPDYFLKFYDGCPANEAVVRIVENKNLPICHIENRNQNHKIISLLRKLSIIEKNKTDLYEYEVLSSLCTLWLEFCHITALQKSAIRKTIQEERMTMFLRFISEHFSEPISLEELAQSANVSKTECLRCFKSLLKKGLKII